MRNPTVLSSAIASAMLNTGSSYRSAWRLRVAVLAGLCLVSTHQSAHAGWGAVRDHALGQAHRVVKAAGTVASQTAEAAKVAEQQASINAQNAGHALAETRTTIVDQTHTNISDFWHDNRDWAAPVLVAAAMIGGCVATGCTVDAAYLGTTAGGSIVVGASISEKDPSKSQQDDAPRPEPWQTSDRIDSSQSDADAPSMAETVPTEADAEARLGNQTSPGLIPSSPAEHADQPREMGGQLGAVTLANGDHELKQFVIDSAADKTADAFLPPAVRWVYTTATIAGDIAKDPAHAPEILSQSAVEGAETRVLGEPAYAFLRISLTPSQIRDDDEVMVKRAREAPSTCPGLMECRDNQGAVVPSLE